jgi:hypothetical protein
LIIPLEFLLVAFSVAATIDAARKPRSAFDRSGKSRWFWILAPVLAGGGCFFLLGPVIAVAWFASVRPSVVAAIGYTPPAS